MKIIIYKKGDLLFSLCAEKTPRIQKFLDENFKVVKCTRKDVFDSIEVNSFEDLKQIRAKLDEYKFRIYVIEQKQPELTEIILRLDILNNPFYSALIKKTEEKNDVETNKANVQVAEIHNIDEWNDVQIKFNFSCDFGQRFF